MKIKSADGSISRVKGLTDPMEVKIAGSVVNMPLAVIDNDENEVLLGLDWFKAADAGIFPAKGVLQVRENQVPLIGVKQDNDENVVFEMVEENEFEESPDCFEFDGKKIKQPENLTKEQRDIFRQIIEDYEDVFAADIADLGQCNIGEHVIETVECSPVYIPPYRISQAEREFLKKEMESMLENGIIEPSTSEWSANSNTEERWNEKSCCGL